MEAGAKSDESTIVSHESVERGSVEREPGTTVTVTVADEAQAPAFTETSDAHAGSGDVLPTSGMPGGALPGSRPG